MSEPVARGGDEILLAFARALRAGGVPVTQDRTQGFLAATATLGADDPVAVRTNQDVIAAYLGQARHA